MAARPNPQIQNPFYIQVTPQKIDYTDFSGASKSHDLPLVTLPPGTVLFRGLRIPNPGAGEDVRYFYRDFLGDPEGKDFVCLKPTHNVFFYPVPYVAFGADTIGKTFHSMQAVVLVHPMTVVCNISPAKMVRSDAYGFSGDAPYQRCDQFKTQCHDPSTKELEALRYDNCLDPKFQKESGVRGWMAIADRDSIKPSKVEDRQLKETLHREKRKATVKDSPMGKYLLSLESRQPGLGPMALAWMYADLRESDKRAHAGFPEIALYPYRIHPGDRLVKRKCATQEHAINLMEREASLNNLNYLPLAAFTESGTVDMINGHFSYECLGVSERTFAIPAVDQQGGVETRMREWMDYCQTKGLNLPFYGPGKLSFDMRTGFYVFPQMLPKNIRLRLPEKDARGRTDIPYEYLAVPLDTEEAKQRVLTYMLMFRSFIPGEYMKMFPLLTKFGIPRAMVFNRPPVLKWVFEELDMKIPDTFRRILGRSATQYKANTGAKSKKDMEAEAAAARELAIALQDVVQSVPYGDSIFFKLYKDSGEVAAQFTFEQWRSMRDPQYLHILKLAGREPSVAEKMEKQYKLKMNVNTTPEARAPPSSPITNMKEEETIPEDIRGKRDYLFKSQIAAQNLKYIQVDETALYSVTDGDTAIEQAEKIKKTITGLTGFSAKDFIITDGTANVGGNTIAFGREFHSVNSVEISPLRASLLANNIMVAGTQENTTVHVADYTKIWRTLQQNIIFLDPPWGGKNYKKRDKLDLFLGATNVNDLIKDIAEAKAANIIAMKVPINYNLDKLEEKLGSIILGIEKIYMKKQDLIIIIISQDILPLGKGPITPILGSTNGATTPYIGYGPSTPVLGSSTSSLHRVVTPTYGNTGGLTPPYDYIPPKNTRPLWMQKQEQRNKEVAAAKARTPPAYAAKTPVLESYADKYALLEGEELQYYNQVKAAIDSAREKGESTPSPIYNPGMSTERALQLYEMAKGSTTPPTSGGGNRKNKTRSKKSYRSKTRKVRNNKNSPVDFAKAFSRVWGAHARNQ